MITLTTIISLVIFWTSKEKIENQIDSKQSLRSLSSAQFSSSSCQSSQALIKLVLQVPVQSRPGAWGCPVDAPQLRSQQLNCLQKSYYSCLEGWKPPLHPTRSLTSPQPHTAWGCQAQRKGRHSRALRDHRFCIAHSPWPLCWDNNRWESSMVITKRDHRVLCPVGSLNTGIRKDSKDWALTLGA